MIARCQKLGWPFTGATGNLLRAAVAQLSIGRLQAWLANPLVILVYHAAGDAPPDHLKHLRCWRNRRKLEDDLDFFLRSFTPVALDDVVAHRTEGRPLPKDALHLTIDDGLRETTDTIAPLCRKKGIPATLFLTTNFLDNRSLGYRHLASLLVERITKLSTAKRAALQKDLCLLFQEHGLLCIDLPWSILAIDYPRRALLDAVAIKLDLDVNEFLKTDRPYLERSEVSDLVEQGFTVGAHSLDHPHFRLISPDEQYHQVAESLRQLCDWFAPRRKVFAFPFDSVSVEPDLTRQFQRLGMIDAFFGVDWRLPNGSPYIVESRIPMDADCDRPARAILKEVYSKNIVYQWRSKRAQLMGNSGELQPVALERQS